jgi:hypothetical protein
MVGLCVLTMVSALILCGGLSCDDSDSSKDSEDSDPYENTWTDSTTNLMWQNGFDVGTQTFSWDAAVYYCQTLSWADKSGWRLPTISELRSLIRGCSNTATGGPCGVTDDCMVYTCWSGSCGTCGDGAGPSPDGAYWPSAVTAKTIGGFWSSSEYMMDSGPGPDAWMANFYNGLVMNTNKSTAFYARCVR